MEFNSIFSQVPHKGSIGLSLFSEDMTKGDFTLLNMADTGRAALKIKIADIKRFNEMEAALKAEQPVQTNFMVPRSFADALQIATDSQRQIEAFLCFCLLTQDALQKAMAKLNLTETCNYIIVLLKPIILRSPIIN